jgi:UDP-glucuronate 4-epimerase
MASTSSVYGGNTIMPYSETHKADHQMSFYAATKKSTENIAHSYAHLFSIPITMFRFFTVYGPWGRPDMALFKFTKSMLAGEKIDVFNFGKMQRDFTYIDDLIESIWRLIDCVPNNSENEAEKTLSIDSKSSIAPFRVVNIGNSKPAQLMDFISEIEKVLGVKAEINFLPMQPGDVPCTIADATLLENLIGYKPATKISVGVKSFIEWYIEVYKIEKMRK